MRNVTAYKDKYNEWLLSEYFDEKTKAELLSISDNEKEIEDRFYKDLDFGTGGLRGILGAGSNRLNIYTIRKVTQGLANKIIKEGKTAMDKGVAIAYDSRQMSKEFSKEAALCLNANGIKTYRFDILKSTPELSFAVKELNCIAGIVITASHNPSQYNGYKIYWEDAAQVTCPKDKEIISEVNKITDYFHLKTMNEHEARDKGLYNIIGTEIDKKYIQVLKNLVINKDMIKTSGKEIKIVYSPLHGTGNIPVRIVLAEIGFENVYVVSEQEFPDGEFPTVKYPNPEDPKAFEMALDLAKKVDADIVLATDPDADRLGMYVKDNLTCEYVAFTGNMSGIIIAEYIMNEKNKKAELPEDGVIIKTIVTSNMINAVAKSYNKEIREVLTGFKYIGEQIKLMEDTKIGQYIFGMEESYGCLVGTYTRDKDAVSAAMVLCEVAAYYYNKGMTLWDNMLELYEKYGYYKEDLVTLTLTGIDGIREIEVRMDNMRNNIPKMLGNKKVLRLRDYQNDSIIDLETGNMTKIGLNKSNVLYFELESNAWCCVRPSGTEPKIKFYFGVKGESIKDAEKQLEVLKCDLLNRY
jgi:Phosphomannomutase